MTDLTHIDAAGRARMVDIADKDVTKRSARVRGYLKCLPETLALVRSGKTPKGAVISTAEIAGIMAAKRTAELIPMCHPLQLSRVSVHVSEDAELPGFVVEAEVSCRGQTGVEMEALTAVSTAALTLFDMLKAVDKTMEIGGIRVTAKQGGKSGAWG